MPETIPVSFKDQTIELPKCKAIDDLVIVPGMHLTQNQIWAIMHGMEADEDPGVQSSRSQLNELVGPIPSIVTSPEARRA